MTQTRKDPLLLASRLLLRLLMGLMVFITGALLLALPVLLVTYPRVSQALVEHGSDAPAWAIIVLLALLTVMTALGFLFFRNLLRMVGTVGDGDPFIPINADRLRAMGWIVVGANLLLVPVSALGSYIDALSDKPGSQLDFNVGGGFDVTGLLLALVLFILARVFREGARMRDELEGTV